MNKNVIMAFARNNGYEPLAWFRVNYPAYALKVKYCYPTLDPSDFQDRALLRLIDAGIPYKKACDLLLIDDPHESILRRFKNDNPPLVGFDHELNRIALTPIGQSRVERVKLTRPAVASCFVDGKTGAPFPRDVVNLLEDRRFHYEEVGTSYCEYPFMPVSETSFENLNLRLREGNNKKELLVRLTLPENATETTITGLDPVWITDLSIGVFLKNGKSTWFIFVGDSDKPVSPFGYLEKPDLFKLTVQGGNKRQLGYQKKTGESRSIVDDKDPQIAQAILYGVEQFYGKDIFHDEDLHIDPVSGQCVLSVGISALPKIKRGRILQDVSQGLFSIPLIGGSGQLFIRLDADKQVADLAALNVELNKMNLDWVHLVESVQSRYPDKWRFVLLEIGRHDLLFKYDVQHFIKYQ